MNGTWRDIVMGFLIESAVRVIPVTIERGEAAFIARLFGLGMPMPDTTTGLALLVAMNSLENFDPYCKAVHDQVIDIVEGRRGTMSLNRDNSLALLHIINDRECYERITKGDDEYQS